VLDSQVVRSHAVDPDLAAALTLQTPIPLPWIVKLPEPVAAPFDRPTPLTTPVVLESTSLKLPARQPAVTIVFLLLCSPIALLHSTEVSLAHSLLSHDVDPERDCPLMSDLPMFVPSTDTRCDPVDTALPGCRPLIAAPSYDIPREMLALPTPDVTTKVTDPPTPLLDRDTAAVSDIHVEHSLLVLPVLLPPLYIAAPKPPPDTVILAEPLTAPFITFTTLNLPESAENITVPLPAPPPTENEICLLPHTPLPCRHTAPVSDAQLVDSHAVPRTRNDPLDVAEPKPFPYTVVIADPVTATFPLAAALNVPVSAESPSVMLATRKSTVHEVCRLRDTASDVLQASEDSDFHPVLSPAVPPTRAPALLSTCPIPAPYTVRLLAPVDTKFTVRAPLILPASTVTASVTLLALSPAVATTRALPVGHPAATQVIDVSDIHVEDSHPVWPALALLQYIAAPIPAPCTVRLADPVPPTFTTCILLIMLTSTEKPMLILPARTPELIDTSLLPPSPWPTRHLVELSDVHSVLSQADRPDLAAVVPANVDRPPPSSVTLADPEPRPFDRLIVLKELESADDASVSVPARLPTLADARKLVESPCPDRHTILESADHFVASLPDSPPALARIDTADCPNPDPCRVTLPDPVATMLDTVNRLMLLRSPDSTSVWLPGADPTVIETRRLPPAPAPAWHRTLLADIHAVISQNEPLIVTPCVIEEMPRLAPSTVRLLEPVVPTLATCIALATPTSVDNMPVKLSTRDPIERAALRVWAVV
jgi:hypothetical protein